MFGLAPYGDAPYDALALYLSSSALFMGDIDVDSMSFQSFIVDEEHFP